VRLDAEQLAISEAMTTQCCLATGHEL
jgi:hypothetical protein